MGSCGCLGCEKKFPRILKKIPPETAIHFPQFYLIISVSCWALAGYSIILCCVWCVDAVCLVLAICGVWSADAVCLVPTLGLSGVYTLVISGMLNFYLYY